LDFRALTLEVLFDQGQVTTTEKNFEGSFFDFLLSWRAVAAHGLNPFGVKYWVDVLSALVFKPNIALLGQQDGRMVYLSAVLVQAIDFKRYFLKLQFDGLWIHSRDGVSDIFSDIESFFFAAALKVYKETIGISIDNFCAPLGCGMNYLNSLINQLNTHRETTFSSVSRPVCTILSAISAQGIRPEKEAEVYP
jgi:hypothetical protein